jgi:hypothetical protein
MVSLELRRKGTKMYVDDKYIPEKCGKCKFIGNYESGIYSRNPHCCCELYWDLHQNEIRVDKNSRDERCPLQSLTDYTKQVRKEVCEQVKTELLDISHEYWRVFKQNGKQYMTSDDMAEYLDVILDQIQGETKC